MSVGADVTSYGRLFQRQHPATGNARSPTVDNRARRIASCMDDDDRNLNCNLSRTSAGSSVALIILSDTEIYLRRPAVIT